ncbi:MAG: hypothetical protein ACREFS_11670 [Acetobacteraceae bacterium]
MKVVLLLTPGTLFLALVFSCATIAAIAGVVFGSAATVIAAVGVSAIVFYFAGALRARPW